MTKPDSQNEYRSASPDVGTTWFCCSATKRPTRRGENHILTAGKKVFIAQDRQRRRPVTKTGSRTSNGITRRWATRFCCKSGETTNAKSERGPSSPRTGGVLVQSSKTRRLVTKTGSKNEQRHKCHHRDAGRRVFVARAAKRPTRRAGEALPHRGLEVSPSRAARHAGL